MALHCAPQSWPLTAANYAELEEALKFGTAEARTRLCRQCDGANSPAILVKRAECDEEVNVRDA